MFKPYYEVQVIERDSWSGPSLLNTAVFDGNSEGLKKAKEYQNNINKQNTSPTAPEYYVMAENPRLVNPPSDVEDHRTIK